MGSITRFKVIDNSVPSIEVLTEAAEAGIDSAVVLGFDKDGMFYFASAHEDGMKTLWLLEQARYRLIQASIEIETHETPVA